MSQRVTVSLIQTVYYSATLSEEEAAEFFPDGVPDGAFDITAGGVERAMALTEIVTDGYCDVTGEHWEVEPE